jgi:hypothetical protein
MPALPGRTFCRVRLHLVSRVCAIWCIGLILIPFTAPFKTFDLNSSTSHHTDDGLPKDKTDSDNAVGEPAQIFLLTRASHATGPLPFARLNQIQAHSVLRTVLRL